MKMDSIGWDLEKLLWAAVSAAQAAGEVILDCDRSTCQSWDKTVDNPVTEADLAADELLRATLVALTPGCGWLSEETVDTPDRLNSTCVWVVDPLDGTREFIEGLDEFAVSVALVARGLPLLGVVHNPATKETIAGIVGQGVVYNGAERGAVSKCAEATDAYVLVSSTEIKSGMWTLYEDVLGLRSLGSAAYKLGRVAAGFADAYVSLKSKHEWDVCAGVALVLAAGGRVTDLSGHDLRFNRADVKIRGIVSANPVLHASLMDVLRSGRCL
jgi:myo-inositol-1(or 4)-monophosphatase